MITTQARPTPGLSQKSSLNSLHSKTSKSSGGGGTERAVAKRNPETYFRYKEDGNLHGSYGQPEAQEEYLRRVQGDNEAAGYESAYFKRDSTQTNHNCPQQPSHPQQSRTTSSPADTNQTEPRNAGSGTRYNTGIPDSIHDKYINQNAMSSQQNQYFVGGNV